MPNTSGADDTNVGIWGEVDSTALLPSNSINNWELFTLADG